MLLQRRAQLRLRRDEESGWRPPNLMIRSAAAPRVSNHGMRTELFLVLVFVLVLFLLLVVVVLVVVGRFAVFIRFQRRLYLFGRQTFSGFARGSFGRLAFAQALVVFPGVEQQMQPR